MRSDSKGSESILLPSFIFFKITILDAPQYTVCLLQERTNFYLPNLDFGKSPIEPG